MPYISSSGNIGGDRGWSLSRIPDLFWGIINFIVFFFQTLINPNLTKHGDGYSSSYSAPGRGPPPGPPSRRIGRIHRDGGPAPPPMGGG